MRETYRLNKNELITFSVEQQLKIHIAFQYIATEIETFQTLNVKMQTALGKIIQKLSIDETSETNNWIPVFNTNIYLQIHHFTVETAKLQVYSNLLRILYTSNKKTWCN